MLNFFEIFNISLINVYGVNMSEIPSKICKKCNVKRYHFEFGYLSRSYDKLNSICKSCIKIDHDAHLKRNFPPKAKDYPYV